MMGRYSLPSDNVWNWIRIFVYFIAKLKDFLRSRRLRLNSLKYPQLLIKRNFISFLTKYKPMRTFDNKEGLDSVKIVAYLQIIWWHSFSEVFYCYLI